MEFEIKKINFAENKRIVKTWKINERVIVHQKIKKRFDAEKDKKFFGMKIPFQKYLLLPYGFLILFLSIFASSVAAQEKKFVVVIDAGHGGHDPGAMGKISREKDINLAVAKELAKLMENNKELKVVLTRKTDKYLTLQERADIANENHADLFICIHTNSSKSSSAYGAETYTLGLAKTNANLEVAMRENSVILLEENYQTKYQGFDPTSVDSYIMFEFMQDKYLDKSIEFASLVQQHLDRNGRLDRGVRQAGFWVLHRSACPSTLIELGFISNLEEELFLSSEYGQKKMAQAIYTAFLDFKKEHDKRNGKPNSTSVSNQAPSKKSENIVSESQNNYSTPIQQAEIENINTANITNQEKQTENILPSTQQPVFKLQILASKKKLSPQANELKGLKSVDYYIENELYKYTVGAETDYNKIVQLKNNLSAKFPQAFIVAFVNGKKVDVKEALRLTGK